MQSTMGQVLYCLPHDWITECGSLAIIKPSYPNEFNYSHLTISQKMKAAITESEDLHVMLQDMKTITFQLQNTTVNLQ